MTSQVFRIKEHFKAIGFHSSEIRARVIKNKYGENCNVSIRLSKAAPRALRDKVVRLAPQIAKAGYNVDITFYNGKVLHVMLSEAPYGKKGSIDYGQRHIMLQRWIRENKIESED